MRCRFWLAVIVITGFTITACPEPKETPRLTGTVSIIGTGYVGEILTANTNSLGGKGAVTFKWKRGTGGAAFNIGTNSNTYVVQAADEGSTVTVTVTRSGYSGSKTSNPTVAIIFPQLTGTVSITGTARSGETLTANTDNLGGSGAITYQWKLGGTGGGVNIGANSNTYVVQAADEGYTITVTVTRSDYSGSKTSAPTAAVTLPALSGSVTITGTAALGQALTANTGSLGGTGTISYQWKRDTTNTGTNSATYVLQAADAGYTITVTVTRAGYSGSVTSNAILFGQRTYGDYVKKVEFTGNTATVSFDNLSGNNVYLVKVNKSASEVAAANTGSVQSVSPSFLSDGPLLDNGVQSPPLPFDERPRMGHPAHDALRANPPPVESETIGPRADIIPPRPAVVGETRSFYVETSFNSGSFVQRQATLLATGTYGNIWVYNNGITTAQAQELSRNFDIIYPAETNILGYEYGGGPGGNGGRDGDPKIQILVYNIGGSVLGFFWAKDYYETMTGSNKAEIFYINSSYINRPELIYLTLAHEFQHMINWNRKRVENGRISDDWYDETLSMMAEDVMADILSIPTTNLNHPVRDHIPLFLDTYTQVGFTEWPSSPYPYSKGYTFGAYLLRNYGGADLLRRILANNTVDTASITAALNEIEPGMTFEKAVSRFGEAMIFSGNSKPEGAHTLDKTVTTTVTGNNGTHTYTLPAFDIWNTRRSSSAQYGPVVYSLTQMAMRGHTVLIQDSSAWRNRSGSFSITLNRPSSASIEMYLMVR